MQEFFAQFALLFLKLFQLYSPVDVSAEVQQSQLGFGVGVVDGVDGVDGGQVVTMALMVLMALALAQLLWVCLLPTYRCRLCLCSY